MLNWLSFITDRLLDSVRSLELSEKLHISSVMAENDFVIFSSEDMLILFIVFGITLNVPFPRMFRLHCYNIGKLAKRFLYVYSKLATISPAPLRQLEPAFRDYTDHPFGAL